MFATDGRIDLGETVTIDTVSVFFSDGSLKRDNRGCCTVGAGGIESFGRREGTIFEGRIIGEKLRVRGGLIATEADDEDGWLCRNWERLEDEEAEILILYLQSDLSFASVKGFPVAAI